ncbi:MAG: acetyl-CoA carboxylase biotin carboxyl carrier protein [Bryobacteraceae bacterium]
MMTIDEIKELIQILQETGIAELEVQRGDSRVRIRRATSQAQDVIVPAVLPMTMGGAAQPVFSPASSASPILPAPSSEPPSQPDESENDIVIKSPIVGTYYDSPAPGAPTFVKVGDRVEPKRVLCIIESMKLMNEIEAEVAGIVMGKLVENGRPVEYGESLFTLRPLSA